jgi:hypothetical protein
MWMVVRRDDRNTGKMGKKIARTLIAGMVVVPGVFGGSLIVPNHIAKASPMVPIPDSITLYYNQSLNFSSIPGINSIDFNPNAYNVRTSSDHLKYTYDSGVAHLESSRPGTYTVYLYHENLNSDYFFNEDGYKAFESFDVIVPYPDADSSGAGLGLIDISDIVKYLTRSGSTYDNDDAHSILGWVDSLNETPNAAPTVSNTPWVQGDIYSNCNSSFSLNSMFSDDDSTGLNYKIVGNSSPEFLNAVIIGNSEYENDIEEYIVNDNVAFMPSLNSGTTTITVRAFDDFGLYADRSFNFEKFYNLDYYSSQEITNYFQVEELEEINTVTATVVNHSVNIGTVVPTVNNNGGSISLDVNVTDYPEEDENPVVVVKVEVSTTVDGDPGPTHTEYFKVTVRQPG